MDCTTNISQYVYRMEESEPLRKYFNSTKDYLLFLYGPKHNHLSLPVTWIYALIFIVCVSGNLLVCLVILKHRSMKTSTNCCLFSLAISDLLVLLFGMPLEIYEMWNNYPLLFGLVGCYLKTVFFETICFASVLIITLVSIERYMAVLHPFQVRLKNIQQRALRIILILWFLSILFSLPNTSIHGIVLQYFPNHTEIPGSAVCAVVKSMWIYKRELTSLLFYVLSLSVISVLYCLMGLKVKLIQVLMSWEYIKPRNYILYSALILSLTVVLVIVFGVYWAPFHTDRLFYSVFFYLSSAVNPIIYHVLSWHFRVAFLSVIFPQSKYWHPRHPTSHPNLTCVLSPLLFSLIPMTASPNNPNLFKNTEGLLDDTTSDFGLIRGTNDNLPSDRVYTIWAHGCNRNNLKTEHIQKP
uniref:Neuromedin U receptor 2 n=1 Tax=Laticauda laticaudata TaxID=8630 RepID=A0A8C5S299_LATLA